MALVMYVPSSTAIDCILLAMNAKFVLVQNWQQKPYIKGIMYNCI